MSKDCLDKIFDCWEGSFFLCAILSQSQILSLVQEYNPNFIQASSELSGLSLVGILRVKLRGVTISITTGKSREHVEVETYARIVCIISNSNHSLLPGAKLVIIVIPKGLPLSISCNSLAPSARLTCRCTSRLGSSFPEATNSNNCGISWAAKP